MEGFTQKYYDNNYINTKDKLPSGDNDLFESNPVTIPFHNNFTLVGHMDFDGNLDTIDVLEKVVIKKPEDNSYLDFNEIVKKSNQEVEIIFNPAHYDGERKLHFRFILHELDNMQPIYFCYYVDDQGKLYPMSWIGFALRNTKMRKHIYLYVFQFNLQFPEFMKKFQDELRKLSYKDFKKMLSEKKVVYKWYVMKFGSSYNDQYISKMTRNDYLLDINYGLKKGSLTDFTIMGHNDFDSNIVTKDNIKINGLDDGTLRIDIYPTLVNYGKSVSLFIKPIDKIWRYNKVHSLDKYGIHEVNLTYYLNGVKKNYQELIGNDYLFATIKKSKTTSNYMIIIFRLKESVYREKIDKQLNDANSEYYNHLPRDINKKLTYFDILKHYPMEIEEISDLFSWIIIKPESHTITTTDNEKSITKPVTTTPSETTQSSSYDITNNNLAIYLLLSLIVIVIIYIIYTKLTN